MFVKHFTKTAVSMLSVVLCSALLLVGCSDDDDNGNHKGGDIGLCGFILTWQDFYCVDGYYNRNDCEKAGGIFDVENHEVLSVCLTNRPYYVCDMTRPNMTLIGENPVEVGLDNLMMLDYLLGAYGWQEVIKHNQSDVTDVIAEPIPYIDFRIKDIVGNDMGYEIGMSPIQSPLLPNQTYLISYTIRRLACRNGNEATFEFIRTVNTVPYSALDQPVVQLNGQDTINHTKDNIYTDLGATANEANGMPIETFLMIEVRVGTPNSQPMFTIAQTAVDASGSRVSTSLFDQMYYGNETTYYITYIAQSTINGSIASVTRVVNIIAE